MSFKHLAGQSPEGGQPLRGRCWTRLSLEPREREKTHPFHVRRNSPRGPRRRARALGARPVTAPAPPAPALALAWGRSPALPATSRSLDIFRQLRFCSAWERVVHTRVQGVRIRDDDGAREERALGKAAREGARAATRSDAEAHGLSQGAASRRPGPGYGHRGPGI